MSVTGLLCALALAAPPLAPQAGNAPETGAAARARWLADLDSASPVRATEALERLTRLGEECAESALTMDDEAWRALPLLARRARVELFARTAGTAQVGLALARLDDPDETLRRRLVDYLSSPHLRAASAAERTEALERIVLEAAAEDLRLQALRGLARIEAPVARAALERCLLSGPAAVQLAAARALSKPGRDPEPTLDLIRRATTNQGARFAAPVLSELVGDALAEALARSAAGAETDADRGLVSALLRHPDALVAQAARDVLLACAERCAQRGDAARGQRVLAGALDLGNDDFELLVRAARLALQYGGRSARAAEAASEIVRRHPASGDSATRTRRAAGLILQGAAALAAREPVEARASFAAADALLSALALEGGAARMLEIGGAELDVLVMRALVVLHQLTAEIAAGREDTHTLVLELAREVDLRVLGVRRALARRVEITSAERSVSYDDLLFHELGPVGLYFGTRDAAGYSRERWIEIERGVYQALANVSRGLAPGFEARAVFDERLSDPLLDDERRTALEHLRDERHKALNDALARRLATLEREVQERDADPSELIQALTWQRLLAQRQREEFEQPLSALLRLREFSRAGLVMVERLRENGRTAAARQLAEQVVGDLEALRGVLDDGQFELLLSRADSALGGVLMDQDQPAAAEAVLTKALDRLRALEERVKTDGRAEGSEVLRSAIAGVLVSLAVNANVKLRDPERALGYFERAFALDQSDFMRVMLACYRARAGRGEEARAILRETEIGPSNFYNAACTHALLGDVELALDYLRRDFEELRTSAGARERQKEWARSDPDLEALRDDPRLRELLRPAEAEGVEAERDSPGGTEKER